MTTPFAAATLTPTSLDDCIQSILERNLTARNLVRAALGLPLIPDPADTPAVERDTDTQPAGAAAADTTTAPAAAEQVPA